MKNILINLYNIDFQDMTKWFFTKKQRYRQMRYRCFL